MPDPITPAEYAIRTVRDFLKVPEARRDVCLREFMAWLKIMELLPVALGDVSEHVRFPREFVWIDDGKGEVTIGLNTDEGDKIFGFTGKLRNA